MAKDGRIHILGILASFIFGAGIGLITYLLTKIFNLKGWIWYIPFFFCPPFIGAIIYALSNKR